MADRQWLDPPRGRECTQQPLYEKKGGGLTFFFVLLAFAACMAELILVSALIEKTVTIPGKARINMFSS